MTPPLSRDQIELLAEKKLSGILTPEEQALLDQWLQQEPGRQMLWESDDSDEAALRERLLKRIREDAGISRTHSGQPGIVLMLHRYRRIAAAILLLLMAGGSCFLLFRRTAVLPGVAYRNRPVQDKPAGRNGAILMLANGSRIVLDSAHTGQLASQGSMQLVKIDSGLLAYTGVAAGKGNTGSSRSGLSRTSATLQYNALVTPRGRQFEVMLSDGSRVWLNAASSITYPTAFAGAERKVTITGEAYFEVADDPQHPFIVSTGPVQVTVLGTHFDIMAYRDEKQVQTTLLEGSVRVSKDAQQVVIVPGQQASFSRQSDQISVERVETDQAIAWVEGKLSLDNLDVEAIMRQVSRWYDVDVVYEGAVPRGHFWGVINRSADLSSVLDVMRANGIDARLEGNTVIVSSK